MRARWHQAVLARISSSSLALSRNMERLMREASVMGSGAANLSFWLTTQPKIPVLSSVVAHGQQVYQGAIHDRQQSSTTVGTMPPTARLQPSQTFPAIGAVIVGHKVPLCICRPRLPIRVLHRFAELHPANLHALK